MSWAHAEVDTELILPPLPSKWGAEPTETSSIPVFRPSPERPQWSSLSIADCVCMCVCVQGKLRMYIYWILNGFCWWIYFWELRQTGSIAVDGHVGKTNHSITLFLVVWLSLVPPSFLSYCFLHHPTAITFVGSQLTTPLWYCHNYTAHTHTHTKCWIQTGAAGSLLPPSLLLLIQLTHAVA